jgi:peptidoglycan hydrolase-like protein with peptidoglycan-binding domain
MASVTEMRGLSIMALLRRGLCGEPVRILQENLGVNADGIFGKDTEAALIQYQNDNGLSADGIAGPDTFTAMGLDELVLLERPIRGQLVRRLQEGLGIDADGIFGAGTEAAVRKFQEENGLDVTGQAGPETLRHVPGFDYPDEKVEASLVSESTPTVDPSAVEQVRSSEEAPPQHEGFIAHAVHSAEEAVASVGRSIWTTVRSIF